MSQENTPFVELSNAMAAAVEKAGAATVLVDARRRLPASGIVYAPDLVLTASHVVEREEEISVLFADGTQINAQLAGRDPASDIAVLRLERNAPHVAEAAPQPARVGELVLALGRPSAGGIEASLGVVSAVGGPARTPHGGLIESYLRTDTIPYPGFSGGPLVNAAGQVVGINTSGLTHGAALTIPAALAWQTAATLVQHGRVRRGYLGVRSQVVELPAAAQQALKREQPSGLLIVGVEPNSPAEKGGMMVSDILVGVGGEAINDPDELASTLTGSTVGQATPIDLLRGGQPLTVQVVVGERGA